MVRKKIDSRIRIIIENGVANRQRTLFVIVGSKARDQVVILHHMLSKSEIKARPSVLWCYKKDLGFSSHRKKRMKQLQKRMKHGTLDIKDDNPFELFVAATNIRYCYYNETHTILGNTYGMCVLQDFEALTPNLLARTIETVEGGGIVVILLKSVTSLKQLYTLTMDVHARYRTEAHDDVVCRFNERFILSLASCKNSMVIDDNLTILPISSHVLRIEPVPPKSIDDIPSQSETELLTIKETMRETQPVGSLINLCRSLDQAKAFLYFVDAISDKTLRNTVAMTAARGRGKSAALGLAVSAAVAFGYSNIFVTSPSPENLRTLFEFVVKGFDNLAYQEHLDFELVQSTNPEFNKALIRINIFKEHRQTIQYIHPGDAAKLGQAELVVIDEAAAIPLPLVKALLGPYLIFLSSTVNGYEGTGRSLSLKLISQLRQQNVSSIEAKKLAEAGSAASGRSLKEITLEESIRYAPGDPVEAWLNRLLCLDVESVPRILSGCPDPGRCELYYVNRDTLFSFHSASEAFLQRLISIYVSAHYKNSPNDLQLLSDAPAHHLFCLLGPVDQTANRLPEVLCLLQVCLEGEISKKSVESSFTRGHRASGDMIPWTISQQFQDSNFPLLSGARIVRIATHPDYQSMGYGSKALDILERYYKGGFPLFDEPEGGRFVLCVDEIEDRNLLQETIEPRKDLPPLLTKLTERRSEKLDYLGVSFGLTYNLLRFWNRAGFVPLYVRQTSNDLTAEHTAILVKPLLEEEEQPTWLLDFNADFRRRFSTLLGYVFRDFSTALALTVLRNKKDKRVELTKSDLDAHFTAYDLNRLSMYNRNMIDYRLIMDIVPTLAKLYFSFNRMDIKISITQQAIFLGLGLQYKTMEQLAADLEMPTTQILGFFAKTMKKLSTHVSGILEDDIASSIKSRVLPMEPLDEDMDEELEEGAEQVRKAATAVLTDADLSQYTIGGSQQLWTTELGRSAVRKTISIARSEPQRSQEEVAKLLEEPKVKKTKKKFKQR